MWQSFIVASLFDYSVNISGLACSFLLCMARRKKRDPSGRRMRCDVGSAGAVRTARPSRNHSISGEGDPRALHPRVTGSFLGGKRDSVARLSEFRWQIRLI